MCSSILLGDKLKQIQLAAAPGYDGPLNKGQLSDSVLDRIAAQIKERNIGEAFLYFSLMDQAMTI